MLLRLLWPEQSVGITSPLSCGHCTGCLSHPLRQAARQAFPSKINIPSFGRQRKSHLFSTLWPPHPPPPIPFPTSSSLCRHTPSPPSTPIFHLLCRAQRSCDFQHGVRLSSTKWTVTLTFILILLSVVNKQSVSIEIYICSLLTSLTLCQLFTCDLSCFELINKTDDCLIRPGATLSCWRDVEIQEATDSILQGSATVAQCLLG